MSKLAKIRPAKWSGLVLVALIALAGCTMNREPPERPAATARTPPPSALGHSPLPPEPTPAARETNIPPVGTGEAGARDKAQDQTTAVSAAIETPGQRASGGQAQIQPEHPEEVTVTGTLLPIHEGQVLPAPAPTVDPAIAEQEQLDKAVANAEQAVLAFTAPDRMIRGDTRHVELVVSRNKTLQDLIGELSAQQTESAKVEGHTLALSDTVIARLTPQDDGFAVKSDGSEAKQWLSHQTDSRWGWDITALKAGRHTLHLTISSLIAVGAREHPLTLPPKDYVIAVEVSWPREAWQWTTKNYHWVWGAAIVPAGGWVLRQLKKRLYKRHHTHHHTPPK